MFWVVRRHLRQHNKLTGARFPKVADKMYRPAIEGPTTSFLSSTRLLTFVTNIDVRVQGWDNYPWRRSWVTINGGHSPWLHIALHASSVALSSFPIIWTPQQWRLSVILSHNYSFRNTSGHECKIESLGNYVHYECARYWLLLSFENYAHQTSQIIMCQKLSYEKRYKDIETKLFQFSDYRRATCSSDPHCLPIIYDAISILSSSDNMLQVVKLELENNPGSIVQNSTHRWRQPGELKKNIAETVVQESVID